MPDILDQQTASNRLLSSLSAEDFELLRPKLQAVDLPLRKRLETGNKRIEYLYFPASGIASVVAKGAGQHSIEVGIIGREGVTGLAVVMGTDRSPHETYMQVAGAGHRVSSTTARAAMAQRPTLHRALLNYGHVFMVQTAYTALANGRCKIEERLARWLLMAHDRMEDHRLTITHEFLALMLGVRRPGVTVALNLLEKDGLIRMQRGTILILDRQGLEESANGAYGVPEAELRRVLQ